MPSGSSGTLFKKESKQFYHYNFIVMELEEINSSSSSSIGKEDNANHALNGGSEDHKMVYLLCFFIFKLDEEKALCCQIEF